MSLYPLPELTGIEKFNGDWGKYLSHTYDKFIETLVKNSPTVLGLRLSCKYREPVNNMHFSFWHTITEGEKEEDRNVVFERCERIEWIAHIIKHMHHEDILCCEKSMGRDSHILLWLKSENYLVVLARRSEFMMFKTAYKHRKSKIRQLENDMKKYPDPRKAETAPQR